MSIEIISFKAIVFKSFLELKTKEDEEFLLSHNKSISSPPHPVILYTIFDSKLRSDYIIVQYKYQCLLFRNKNRRKKGCGTQLYWVYRAGAEMADSGSSWYF